MRRRIVSLLPSATEIVCALGSEAELVGRSHECDFPASVMRLPVCTEPKVRVDGNSEDIHASVTEVLRNDISVYRVHSELMRELKPDVIVTQVQCDVCAVSLRDVEASIADWMGIKAPRIVALNPTSRPRVATIEWISPLMAAGNWIPELIELAGGENLFGRAGEHSPWIQPEAFAEAQPDAIVVFPCGFSIDGALADLPRLDDAAGTGKVFVADGNQFFNRPGPRIVESLEILAEILHPELFDFGHRGNKWVAV